MIKVEYTKISKDFFEYVLSKKGYTITELGEDFDIERTGRTIRRALKQGKMKTDLLDRIAKKIDVAPSYLSGEEYILHKSMIKKLYGNFEMSAIRIEDYPYLKAEKSDYKINDYLKNILMFYDISLSQYESFEFEKKIEFLHALDDAIVPILGCFFANDAFGRSTASSLLFNDIQIDSYTENHYLKMYLKELKEKWSVNPPDHKTSNEIRKMSLDDIQDLDMKLKNLDIGNSFNRFLD